MKWGHNVVLALVYFLGGYLGMLLAFPPSTASPVWPASGIALAGLYIYGEKVLPGFLIGSFLTQIYAFSEFWSADKFHDALLIGAIIGCGSILQAALGARLIKHFVGPRDPLISDRKIITFLALGGPVSCLTSASIGVATLALKNLITTDYIAISWLTWWVGDVIGVLVFTPLVMVFYAQPRALWRTRYRSVGHLMILTIVAVSLLFHFGKKFEFNRVETAFTSKVDLLHKALQDELGRHLATSETLKNLFDASETVTYDEFRNFTSFLVKNHPHLQIIAWIPKISESQRQWFESSGGVGVPIREENVSGDWVPAMVRKDYYAIAYVAPLSGNEAMQGADIGANAQALSDIRFAADNNQTIVARWPFMAQHTDTATWMAIYSPLYKPRARLDSLEGRRNAIAGFTANVFRIDVEIAEVYSRVKNLPLLLQIDGKGGQLFSNVGNQIEHKFNYPLFQQKHKLLLANQEWEISYLPSPEFYLRQLTWTIWWLLLGGFSFTGLIGCGLLMLTGRTLKTEEVVRSRTRELETEVNERKRMIWRHENQNRVLRAVASQKPLAEILELIVQNVERDKPGSMCSILLMDKSGKYLRYGAAIGLPDAFNTANDGLEIGPGRGSCGHAAATGELTIVENVFQHPFWRDYTALAEIANIVSCWSAPILSSTGQEVLGTFAFYSHQAAIPGQSDIARIEELSHITSIAIEHKNYEERVMHLAFYDPLTELPNRRLLLDELEKDFAKTRRHDSYYALLFLDLDNFKTLNDSLGHEIGDELIRQVASRLKKCIREEDTVARLGGDEFVVLLRSSTMIAEIIYNLALSLAERIQEAIGCSYMLHEHEHHVTTSIGISVFPKGQSSAIEILKQADTAMYSAKTGGRNSICFYHEDMQKKADRRLEIEKDIRVALTEHQFKLYFQPQFDLHGQLVGAEALLRWVHLKKGAIPTPEVIAIAEETGLILPLSEWVIEEACRKLKQWPELQHLSLNISPRHFRQPDFIDRFGKILAGSGIPAQKLILELTENCLIEDTDDTIAKMRILQEMNIGFSIDDFGTGYSSLSYLKSLPLNQLKIDQDFVRDICIDQNDAVIVETIILMASTLGLDVIAEGVENEEQLKFLKDRGCSVFQGYYFSRPLSAENFGTLFSGENIVS